MAIADRIKDTSTTTGTGDITVSGTAPTGYRTISTLGGVGTTFPYLITNADESQWEVGKGTMTGANSFSRSVQASSNAGAAVNFSGTLTVTCSLTADSFVNEAVTLSNKRIKPRVLALGSGATPAVNTDLYDRVTITSLAVAITGFTMTGTPVDGDSLVVAITDNGTARAIAWGSSFESSTIAPPTTTVGGQKLTVAFDWNAATSKWRCVGSA